MKSKVKIGALSGAALVSGLTLLGTALVSGLILTGCST